MNMKFIRKLPIPMDIKAEYPITPELAAILMERMRHGVTEVRVHGMYSDTDKYMLVCIINKRQIGEMMKIIKRFPGTFASFAKVNEVFGNFKRRVG